MMSATMPENIMKLAWRFMVNPMAFLVQNFQLTLDGIRQYYVSVGEEANKMATLLDLFPIIEKSQSRGMIFCNTRKSVKFVFDKMVEAGHTLGCIVSVEIF